MATIEPQKWSAVLGASADVNTLPATTPAGSGRASTSGLFPPITQEPLDEGGLAPERADFNALFKYLGEYVFYAMQGGVYTYVTTYNYTAGNFVLHEGSLYLCIAANGPGSAVKYPTDTAYWRKLALMSDIPAPPTVNNGTLTIQKNGSTVATFTANQAGNTTANITVPAAPTVNDGQLKINVNGSTVATFTANQAGNTTANITVPAPPTVNNGQLEINVDGSTVATFTANQAGNTTANITISEINSQSVSGGAGWVRFKSGIQIVFGVGNADEVENFPVAFIAEPRLLMTSPTTGGTYVGVPGWYARTTTYFIGNVYDPVNHQFISEGNFDFIAIGFWK